jgi:hypothetical protein
MSKQNFTDNLIFVVLLTPARALNKTEVVFITGFLENWLAIKLFVGQNCIRRGSWSED